MKPKCTACGRKAQTVCPTTGERLCSRCCAKRRGTDVQCGPDCSRYPLGPENYDAFLSLERKLAPKIASRIHDRVSPDEFAATSRELLRTRGGSDEAEAVVAGIATFHFLLSWQDRDGVRIVDRWAESDFDGLNHDERHLMGFMAKAQAVVVEVQNVLDGKRTECADCFSGEKFCLFDYSLAKQMRRFARMFGFVYHLPYYSKLLAPVPIPHLSGSDYVEALRKEYASYQSDHPGGTMNGYLTANYLSALDMISATAKERTRRVLESMDARECISLFRIQCDPEEILDTLGEKPEFEYLPEGNRDRDDEGDCYDWLARGESGEFETRDGASRTFDMRRGDDMVMCLGSVGVAGDTLRLKAFSRERHEFCKEMLDRFFGPKLKMFRERVTDLAKQVLARDEEDHPREPVERPDGPGVPLNVQRTMVESLYREHYEKFLDDGIPALGGMTPRAAAADPHARPKLVELMKSHIVGIDEQMRELESSFNLDWVLEELGLKELL